MDDDIQKAGANARAAGRDLLENPYLESRELPATTGETIEQWQSKHDAWELGWRMEDLIRSG